MAIIDVIKYEGGNNILVWRHPKEDFNTSAQLIVHDSQEAFIYKDGHMQGPYIGKHTINTENIPGVRRLVGLITGGVSPNHYQVYFVNKAYSMDIFWGTASAWTIQDPSLQIPLQLQAHGQFAIKVKDSKQLLLKLVGTTTSFTQRTLQDYFRSIIMSGIKDLISNLIIEEGLTYAELNAYLTEIAKNVKPKLSETFDKYGILLEEFVVEGISIKEDENFEKVKEAMGNRAIRVIEGLDKRSEKEFEVAMAHAQNPGTSGQMSQIVSGIAMGAAVAPSMGGIVRNAMQPMNVSKSDSSEHDQFSMGVVKKRSGNEEKHFFRCAECGEKIAGDSNYCPHCGAPIKKKENKNLSCPVCGASLPADSKFCNICGTEL